MRTELKPGALDDVDVRFGDVVFALCVPEFGGIGGADQFVTELFDFAGRLAPLSNWNM